jgi:hypothetical protein
MYAVVFHVFVAPRLVAEKHPIALRLQTPNPTTTTPRSAVAIAVAVAAAAEGGSVPPRCHLRTWVLHVFGLGPQLFNA